MKFANELIGWLNLHITFIICISYEAIGAISGLVLVFEKFTFTIIWCVVCRPHSFHCGYKQSFTNESPTPKTWSIKNCMRVRNRNATKTKSGKKTYNKLKFELERINMLNIWSYNFSSANATFMHSTDIMQLHNRHPKSKRSYNLAFVNTHFDKRCWAQLVVR